MKEILQKLQKPLAFFAEVCYNVAREKTDVLRVGFPYDFYDFLVYAHLQRTPRHEHFGKVICNKYSIENFTNVLDVGAGRICRLSKYLLDRGYSVTAIDPKIRLQDGEIEGLELIREHFKSDEYSKRKKGTNISEYDLVVGLEPCDATEHIIRQCLKYNKPFEISLCFAPHRALNGRNFNDYKEWHTYLDSISEDVHIEKLPDGQIVASGGKQKDKTNKDEER